MKVLFIGNSYTYYNDMPQMLEKAANVNGKDVQVFSVTYGGAKLCEFADGRSELSKQVEALAANHKFDVCIMQEQSILPIGAYKLFAAGVKMLVKKLSPVVDRFILYQTWGRKDGDVTMAEHGWTNQGMTDALKNAYVSAAELVGAEVSPVGRHFYNVYTKNEDIDLYNEDLTHPSYKGSVLAMLTHYKKIFGEFPENLDGIAITEVERDIFKQII